MQYIKSALFYDTRRQYAIYTPVLLQDDFKNCKEYWRLTIDSIQEIRPEGGGLPAVLIVRLRKSV